MDFCGADPSSHKTQDHPNVSIIVNSENVRNRHVECTALCAAHGMGGACLRMRCDCAGSSLQLIHRRRRATRRCVRRAKCALARRGAAKSFFFLTAAQARGEMLNATLCQPPFSHTHYQLPLNNHHAQ